MTRGHSKPEISVIIPVYNTEKYLPRCLDSVASQTCTSFEVILIDDGSRDGSGRICDAYCAKDDRFQVHHLKNGGVAQARELGLKFSHGDYIAFIDSDDYVDPRYLEKLLEAIRQSDSDVAVCQYYIVNKSRLKKERQRPFPGVYARADILKLLQERALYDKEIKAAGISAYFWGKLYKRKWAAAALEAGRELWYEEDLVGNIYTIFHISGLTVLDGYLYYYVKHEGQVTGTYKSGMLDQYLDILGRLEKMDQEHYLKDQLSYRVLGEVSRILNVCARSGASYHDFRREFENIRTNERIMNYLNQIHLKNLSVKEIRRLKSLQWNLPRVFYTFIKDKK